MIAKRQPSPEIVSASEQVTPFAIADLAPVATADAGPARQLQARLADAIGLSPQVGEWQVDLGHRSSFDTALVPQQARSILAGVSGGAFIAFCLFLMLD